MDLDKLIKLMAKNYCNANSCEAKENITRVTYGIIRVSVPHIEVNCREARKELRDLYHTTINELTGFKVVPHLEKHYYHARSLLKRKSMSRPVELMFFEDVKYLLDNGGIGYKILAVELAEQYNKRTKAQEEGVMPIELIRGRV